MIIAAQKLFDLSFLEQLEDNDFIIGIILLYLKDTDKDLGNMKVAFDEGVIDSVYKIAHKLKSSTGMLQANKLFAVLEQAEKIAEAGLENNRLGELVQTARIEFDGLKKELEIHLQALQTAA